MRAVLDEVGAPRSDQMTGMSEAIEQMFVVSYPLKFGHRRKLRFVFC